MKERRIREIKGIVLISLGLIILFSLVSYTPYDLSFYTSHPNYPVHNLIRIFGAYLSGLFFFLIGWSSFVIPAILFFWAVGFLRQEEWDLRLPNLIGLCVLFLSLSALLSMTGSAQSTHRFIRGGFFGFTFSDFVVTYFGRLGGYVIFTTLALLSFALVTEMLVSAFLINLSRKFKGFIPLIKPLPEFKFKLPKKEKQRVEKPVLIKQASRPEPIQMPAPKIQIQAKQQKPSLAPKHEPQIIGDYQLPALDLLTAPPPVGERQIRDDLASNARILEQTLADFDISVKVTDIERGPVITRYELEPAPGVKLNRIVNLGDDISLAMKAQSVRIVAPIPGKARVGVEVPNSQSSIVYLKEIFSSDEFQKEKSKLTLALGKDISGRSVVSDLGEMPHLLIAGTTGSGKTVCVNGLILSMLYKATPQELKFIMVDPKMVELAPYNGIPHMLCPVITDAKKVSAALAWVVNEMEERYRLLAKAGVRNIESYNEKQEKLPYIVVVIDELADLMVVARDQVEGAITRLAQLSRAVGIHLILATQRPSVDVITGVIKANFPARISFQVASKVDSRTVLDSNGADKLLGRGDMLFLKPGESKLIRAQGSLVLDKEIESVVEFIKSQGEPTYDEEILKEQERKSMDSGEKDELFDEAVRLIMESGQASVSILQRRMRLGYTRAARLIDSMEQEGLVGPYEGSKPRKILVDRKDWLEKDLVKEENA